MARGVGFEGANFVFEAPPGDNNCVDLETFIDAKNGAVISCWRLSDEELDEVKRTGVVWISVQSIPIPPITVSGHALVLIGDRPAKAEPVLPKRHLKDR